MTGKGVRRATPAKSQAAKEALKRYGEWTVRRISQEEAEEIERDSWVDYVEQCHELGYDQPNRLPPYEVMKRRVEI